MRVNDCVSRYRENGRRCRKPAHARRTFGLHFERPEIRRAVQSEAVRADTGAVCRLGAAIGGTRSYGETTRARAIPT